MTGHAFLAIGLSDEERHALSAALHEASPGRLIPGKRQPPANWHITLRFLGVCSEEAVDSILHALDDSLDVTRGRVVCTHIDAFPKPSKAAVLYVGLQDTEQLVSRLAGLCEAVARDVGFEPQERPYVPHLTLSRLRPPQDVQRLIEAYELFRAPIGISAITLFRTRQSRSGLWYEPIETVALES